MPNTPPLTILKFTNQGGGVYRVVKISMWFFPIKSRFYYFLNNFSQKSEPNQGGGVYRVGNRKIQKLAKNRGGGFTRGGGFGMNFTVYIRFGWGQVL